MSRQLCPYIRVPLLWTVALVAAMGRLSADEPPLPPIPTLKTLPALTVPEPAAPQKPAPETTPAPRKAGDEVQPPADPKKEPPAKAPETVPPPKPVPVWKAWQPPGRPVKLEECLATARVRQPTILAAQHSLAASERGYLALMNIHRALELLSPDIPFRRKQAERGIAAATAEVQKAIHESVYDTTRVYFEYVRATQQEQTATDIIDQMEIFYRVAENLLDQGVVEPRMKLNRFTLYALDDAIAKVKQLREKASFGRRLAVAALAEAMGLEPGEQVYPAASKLPVMGGDISEEQVVSYALASRPELVQMAVLVDVTRLEVCAQGAIRHRQSVPTFAGGADLHSHPVPAPVRNGEYRPGAIPPEMPVHLVGKRDDRVARAMAYSERQDEVYRKSVSLVRLEAVNAYLNWKATAVRMEEAEKRFERGKRLVEISRSAAATKQDPELLVRNEALAGEAQATYVEAVFEHLKALMTLERVTAGQVKAGFAGR